MSLILAADLGQARDFTAIIALRRLPPAPGLTSFSRWETVHIERVKLGTSYQAIAVHTSALRTMMVAVDPDVHVAVDGTGVGKAVVEMMRGAAIPNLTAVTITGGRTVGGTYMNPTVPKADLVAGVSVALQNRALLIPADLPHAEALTGELSTFRSATSVDGSTQYAAWRERDHDDLVLALAIGIWVGNRAAGHVTSVSSAARLNLERAGTPFATVVRGGHPFAREIEKARAVADHPMSFDE